MRLTPLALSAIILPALALPAVAGAQSTRLEDMLGARAGQAEEAIERRGWQNVGGQKGDDRSYTYWWNADRRQCVTIATMGGRYNSITPTIQGDCRQSPSRPPRPDYGYGAQSARTPLPGYQAEPGYERSLDRADGRVIIDGRPVDLGLVCFGDGARNGIASGTTWTWNRERDRYEYGHYNESTREVFDATLMVQIWEGGGRIRLPKKLIPPINSRGDQGWWNLYDVQSGPDYITASYRLNGFNKPRLTIDRRSGHITVKGFSDYGFRGTCDLIGDQNRRF